MEKQDPKHYFVAGSDAMSKMIEQVNYFMDEGWMPIGNMVIHESKTEKGIVTFYYQPMVKLKDWQQSASDNSNQQVFWEKPE